MSNFNRLLLLLSNEVMIKSRDVVGPKVLSDPELVCVYMCVCCVCSSSVHLDEVLLMCGCMCTVYVWMCGCVGVTSEEILLY